ncbi:hypothetical protein YS65_003226 [Salmonella enterica subsp. enterica]|nr:hypothetical protein [Salmonella enterica subsp. enterica]EDR5917213.1 hypothetical protein [Salmonella enterica subsp. diarizonae]EEC1444446.1 hypothetical protein [Salmonella enterica]HCM3242518.1 hypothetical protein [Salmonella enterica subsp. enterica serovar Newport]HCM6249606.1 hypothetical protein [Salmonella enterica subsp. enterica serovar 45:b:-]
MPVKCFVWPVQGFFFLPVIIRCLFLFLFLFLFPVSSGGRGIMAPFGS